MAADVGYRIAHHDDLDAPPACTVTEVDHGVAFERGELVVTAALVDHGVVRPAIGYRFSHAGSVAAWSGDTLPCPGLDELCAGAACYVQTVVRRDLVERVPVQRFLDILDYHSDVVGAAKTATAARVGTLVLNHMVPAPVPGTEAEWIALAVDAGFDGDVVVAHDLLTIDC
jgi:ribonuclease Z